MAPRLVSSARHLSTRSRFGSSRLDDCVTRPPLCALKSSVFFMYTTWISALLWCRYDVFVWNGEETIERPARTGARQPARQPDRYGTASPLPDRHRDARRGLHRHPVAGRAPEPRTPSAPVASWPYTERDELERPSVVRRVVWERKRRGGLRRTLKLCDARRGPCPPERCPPMKTACSAESVRRP